VPTSQVRYLVSEFFGWFGLFAASYGRALILRSILIPEWNARVDLVVVIVERLISLASRIAALLLFREFYGKGRRLSSKWLIWTYAFGGSSGAVLHGNTRTRARHFIPRDQLGHPWTVEKSVIAPGRVARTPDSYSKVNAYRWWVGATAALRQTE
jgi:hypothetical protein